MPVGLLFALRTAFEFAILVDPAKPFVFAVDLSEVQLEPAVAAAVIAAAEESFLLPVTRLSRFQQLQAPRGHFCQLAAVVDLNSAAVGELQIADPVLHVNCQIDFGWD